MSRSNPNENGAANPSERWFEWNGEHGVVRYYDRDAKKNVDVGPNFGFVLLDELGGVRGWHDASDSGIYSNEVKDTRQDVLVVKSFKGGTIAEGLYREIKDRVNAAGGSFTANCYLGFKDDKGELRLGCLRFKGAALGAWMEFRKAHRSELYKKGLRITGFTEGQKGRVTFRVPVLKVVELTEEAHAAAVGLDLELQAYLTSYLQKNKRDQVEAVGTHLRDEDVVQPSVQQGEPPMPDDSDIPF